MSMVKILLNGLLTMQVTNNDTNFIIFHKDDYSYLSKYFELDRKLLIPSNDICFYAINNELEINSIKNILSSKYLFCKCLDRYFFLLPLNKPNKRQEIIDIFYSSIAERFESLIDIQRNKNNIDRLIKFFKNQPTNSVAINVLDYGCGTGLSKEFEGKYNINIIGYDRCPIMREIAKKKGLNVINTAQLKKIQPEYFDGAFASYIFHMVPK